MPKKMAVRKGETVAVKILVEPSPATPVYYANYFEVSHSQHDCALTAVRVPTKFSSARQAEFTKSGVLILEPEVQITFPPTLLRPLKDALERQILSYERNVGKIGGKGVADGKKR